MVKFIAGIDEAGRGPLIGPLVIAGVLVAEKDVPKLVALGVKDSKLLSPAQREGMFEAIKGIVKDYKIIIVQPQEVDAAVESVDGLNLNWLEAHKTADILNALKPDKAFIDCPSTNIKKYTEYLKDLLKNSMELVVEHKSDFLHKETGAASILAKVTRDREIEKLQKKVKEPLGSGYPSDPITKEFVKKYWKKYPDIFRHSWSTYKVIADPEKQSGLDKF
ncbi:MAG TPA: ribonuclease HII [Candidatus Nanoarchaeia archaeon]|nr:ribonuclease HII [Candidatus Nanoarchaeia archaeon]